MANIGLVAVDSHTNNYMETEIWKDIDGFEGSYQVSNLGRVKSMNRQVIYSNGRVHLVKEKIIRLSRARNIKQVANQEPYNDKGFTRKQAGGYIWRNVD